MSKSGAILGTLEDFIAHVRSTLPLPALPAEVSRSAIAASSEVEAHAAANLLPPKELSLLATSSSPKRRAQFILGRVAAHAALGTMLPSGRPIPPILRGERGEPLWPQGFIGSLSHDGLVACAIASRSDVYRALGIDLQSTGRRFRHDVSARILRPEERMLLEPGAGEPGSTLLELFSIKESVFKALYPLCRRYFGFHDVVLAPTDAESFTVTLKKSLSDELPEGFTFSARARRSDGVVVSAVTIRSDELNAR